METRVLLVEDSPVAREKVSSILAELGCEVVTAEDGVEGLKVAKQHAGQLDLIVLDIQMPKADGITLLRYLKKIPELASTTIVMLTTQADKETVRTALSHGAKDFLRKDATISHITERLQLHIEQARKPPEPAKPASGEDRQDLVRRLLTSSAKVEALEGPCVLCHLPDGEIHELSYPTGARQLALYEGIARGIGLLNRRYPRLRAAYIIESKAPEVSRMLQASDQIPWVLVLGRRQEGHSLAKMAGLAGLIAGRTFHVICDPIASVDQGDRDRVTRMGALLIEQKDFEGDGTLKLLEEHLMPPAHNLSSGFRYRELSRGEGLSPRGSQKVLVHYSAVTRDGSTVTNTFEQGHPLELPAGDEALPKGIWEVLVQLGRGGTATAENPDAADDEPAYYQIHLVDITDL